MSTLDSAIEQRPDPAAMEGLRSAVLIFRFSMALALIVSLVACDVANAEKAEAIAEDYVESFYRGEGFYEKYTTGKTAQEIEIDRERMSREFSVIGADSIWPGDYEFTILFSNNNRAIVRVVVTDGEVALISMGVFVRRGD